MKKLIFISALSVVGYVGSDVSSKTPTASGKPNLEVGDAKWEAMANFCVANKSLGYKKLCDKIGTKYTLSAGVKNEIKNLIK